MSKMLFVPGLIASVLMLLSGCDGGSSSSKSDGSTGNKISTFDYKDQLEDKDDGIIANAEMGLTKFGRGTLVLAGDITYPGDTIVAEGKLVLEGTSSGRVVVKRGAVLEGASNAQEVIDENPRP